MPSSPRTPVRVAGPGSPSGRRRLVAERREITFFFGGFLVVVAALTAVLAFGVRIKPRTLVEPSTAPLVSAVLPLSIVLLVIGSLVVIRSSAQDLVLFWLGFGTRAVASVILLHVLQIDDEAAIHRAAASGQVRGGYESLVHWLYRLTGPNLLGPKLLNAFLGTVLAFVMGGIARELSQDPRIRRRTLLLALFTPPLIVYSAVNLKEILTALLLAAGVWAALKESPKLIHRAFVFLVIASVTWVRGPAWGLLTAVMSVLALAVRSSRKRWGVLLVAIALPLVLLPLWRDVLNLYVENRLLDDFYRARFLQPGATITPFLGAESPLSIRNLSLLVFRAVYSPSPLRPVFDGGFRTLLESVGSLSWYLLVPIGMIGFSKRREDRRVMLIGLSFLAVFLATAAGVAFGSDPARHRVIALPFLCVLAGLSAEGKPFKNAGSVWLLWGLGALGFTFLYLWLRF